LEPSEATIPDTDASETGEFMAYQQSPEFALRQQTMMFELTLRILKGNFDDLMAILERYRPKTQADLNRLANDLAFRMNQQVDGTRVLHNFVASALSVVDHTRRIYEKLYDGLMPVYEDQRDAILDKHGATQFVIGLRKYSQHYKLPQIIFTTSKRMADPPISGWASFSKDRLLEFDGFNTVAKAYIRASPDLINLEAACSAYLAQVEEFHKWFNSEQERIHQREFAYIARMEEKFGIPM
jgi:hypothetical protein